MASGRSSGWGRNFAAALTLIAVSFSGTVPCRAQASSRAEEVEAARRKKAAELKPEELSTAESRLNKIVDSHLIERAATGFHGLTMVLGGLPVGQGFALGPQYSRPDVAGGALKLRTSARATTGGALLLDFQLTAPKLADEAVFIDFYAAHRNLPRLDYYGQGPDSSLEDESQYRLEDTSFDVTAGFRPFKYRFSRPFSIGVTGGYLKANVDRGNEGDDRQAQDVFDPLTTPGLFDQTSFLRGGFFANYDYRDNPGGPRRGGFYGAKLLYYDDRDLGLRDHRRLDLEAQQYIPFWNDRRVIALRVASTMTFASGTSTVPFYLQSTIGGSNDLRGFRPYRFYGNNAIIANAEYRFESFTGLDMAVFFDAGKVAAKRSQINFHDLEASAGFGFRFNVGNRVFLRFDIGFSHEGTRLWLTFDNVF